MDPWIRQLSSKLGAPKQTTGDEVRFNCWRPNCGSDGSPDTKYHMYVNSKESYFFCQRCRKGGTLAFLAKVLKVDSPERALALWDELINEFVFGTKEITEQTKIDAKAALPLDFVPVIKGTRAAKYLLSRGIDQATAEYYGLGFGTARLSNIPKENQGLYAGRGRIIFPDFDENGESLYWVARTFKDHYAKYKNAKIDVGGKIYNLGRLKREGRYDRIIICEGAISAIAAGRDAVATYGKTVTKEQVETLVDFGADVYYIAIDGDAKDKAVRLANKLFRRNLDVRFVHFSYEEDPAYIGFESIQGRIKEATVWDEFSEVLVY